MNNTVRISESKVPDNMHTKMDVSAIWQDEAWVLAHIQARIKEPSELLQTIIID